MFNLTKKFYAHLQNGTVLYVLSNKLRKWGKFRKRIMQLTPATYRLRYKQYFGVNAANYLAKREHTEGWKQQHKTVVELLDQLPRDIKVLDVPVGTGRFLGEYVNRGYKVFGIDISEDMIKQADVNGRGLENVHLQIGDARKLPYKEKFFDLSVSYKFLGYIPPLKDAIIILKEIHRVTKTWAILDLQARSNQLPKGNIPKMGHKQYMNEVMTMLEEIGFVVVETRDVHKHKNGVTNFTVFCKVS